MTCYFFRDPIRKILYNEQNFLSPADGRIVSIEEWEDPDVGEATKIAIFLSVLNVHRQWTPVSGKVLNTIYACVLIVIAAYVAASQNY